MIIKAQSGDVKNIRSDYTKNTFYRKFSKTFKMISY